MMTDLHRKDQNIGCRTYLALSFSEDHFVKFHYRYNFLNAVQISNLVVITIVEAVKKYSLQ